jgi:hypothetical protein
MDSVSMSNSVKEDQPHHLSHFQFLFNSQRTLNTDPIDEFNSGFIEDFLNSHDSNEPKTPVSSLSVKVRSPRDISKRVLSDYSKSNRTPSSPQNIVANLAGNE